MMEHDLDRFYELIHRLRDSSFERCLRDAHGHMLLPSKGVYFFFDDSEKRHDDKTPRVVRVGTHALTAASRSTLWKRLRQHKGTDGGKRAGGGSHRGSVFRKHVGFALIERDGASFPSRGDNEIPDRTTEHQLELQVSDYIRNLPFLCLSVDTLPGINNARAWIEKNSISLLSCQANPDKPSSDWLGLQRGVAQISRSGLWNVRHVGDGYAPSFLYHFEALVKKMCC